MSDDPTLQFYNANAATYAARSRRGPSPHLIAFLDALPPGGGILELGTGGGRDARVMLDRGFMVTATDGSAQLAVEASSFTGQPVQVMRFDELAATEVYDGVWAAASLLHAPDETLSEILSRVYRALVPGGLAVASFKAGEGPGHDQFGRHYNYPNLARLQEHYAEAAFWTSVSITEQMGSGYDNQPTRWLWANARK